MRNTYFDHEQLGETRKYQRKKGVSYRGAEFTNLKFKVIKNSVSTEFIYTIFDRIIDWKNMLELMWNAPGKWIPAENSKGNKVEQELVVKFGMPGR